MGDFLDELARYTNAVYFDTKQVATSWKAELLRLLEEKFQHDISRLKSHLAAVGVVREEPTIRNWLNDSSLIAPSDYRNVIEKFKDAGFSSAFAQQANSISEAITNTYEMRRGATEEILRVLNAGVNYSEGDKSVRLRFGQQQLEFSVELVEALGSQLSIAANELGSIKRVE